MLINVVDANGLVQQVVWQSQGTPPKNTGTIIATGVSQPVLPANPNRSGWLIQNQSQQANSMSIDDTGGDATVAGFISLPPGQMFSTASGYPVTTGPVNIAGTAGDVYAWREW